MYDNRMSTELYLDSRSGITVDSLGLGLFFILKEPIFAPLGAQLSVQLVSATIPLTHWAITMRNNALHLIFADDTQQTITLLAGNRSIDLLVLKMNDLLMHGWHAAYDETTNLVTFTGGSVGFEVGPNTTCQQALGIQIGQASGLDLASGSP